MAAPNVFDLCRAVKAWHHICACARCSAYPRLGSGNETGNKSVWAWYVPFHVMHTVFIVQHSTVGPLDTYTGEIGRLVASERSISGEA